MKWPIVVKAIRAVGLPLVVTYSRATRARGPARRVRGSRQAARPQTVKIVVQQMPASPVAVPNFAGYSAEKPNKPGKSKF